MVKATEKRVRLTDAVMALAEADYDENYAASGMSFTVYINQKLFENLSGLTSFRQGWAAEGTGRPKTNTNDANEEEMGRADPDDDDDDLDLNQIPDAI